MSSDVFTELQIWPLKQKVGNLKANGSVVIKGTVRVKFTVVEGSNGVFASLPSKKSDKVGEDGKPKYYSEVSIVDENLYNSFQNLVKTEYQKASETDPSQGDNSSSGEGSQLDDGIPF